MFGKEVQEEEIGVLRQRILTLEGELGVCQRDLEEAKKTAAERQLVREENEGLKAENARLQRKISKQEKIITEFQRLIFANLEIAESQKIQRDKQFINVLRIIIQQTQKIPKIIKNFSINLSEEREKQKIVEGQKAAIQAETQTEDKQVLLSMEQGKEKGREKGREEQKSRNCKELLSKEVQQEEIGALKQRILALKSELRTLQRDLEEAKKTAAERQLVREENEGLKAENASLKRKISKYEQYTTELKRLIFENLDSAEAFMIQADQKLFNKLRMLSQSARNRRQIFKTFSINLSEEREKQEIVEGQKAAIQVDTQTEEKQEIINFACQKNEGLKAENARLKLQIEQHKRYAKGLQNKISQVLKKVYAQKMSQEMTMELFASNQQLQDARNLLKTSGTQHLIKREQYCPATAVQKLIRQQFQLQKQEAIMHTSEGKQRETDTHLWCLLKKKGEKVNQLLFQRPIQLDAIGQTVTSGISFAERSQFDYSS